MNIHRRGGARRLSPEPFRFVWPTNTRKRLANRMRVSLETAKVWLRDGVPQHRRDEMARVILAELDQIERQISEHRRAHEMGSPEDRRGREVAGAQAG